MKRTSLIKFMTKEELVQMLVQIKNFRNPKTGKFHHCYKTYEAHMNNKWNRAEYKFNLNNLDFVDVLIVGDGYVRYYGCCGEVLDMMKYRFGFTEEY